jgi:hypothetical protein
MMKSTHIMLLSTLVLALVNIAIGNLVITEIMLQPKSALDPGTQWFEVYNTENIIVQLKGYAFRYCLGISCSNFVFPSLGFIGPFGSAVFGNNVDMATNGGVVMFPVTLGAMPRDGSGTNYLDVHAPNANTVDDYLYWSSDSGASSRPFPPGASMSRISSVTTGQDAANWKTSTAFIDCNKGGDKGTPGKLNAYICPTKTPTMH